MSLVGFKAQNHPQQVKKRGAKPEVDNLVTPWEFFNEQNERFNFNLDVAALDHNAKCDYYLTPDEDGLTRSWQKGSSQLAAEGESRPARVWCNPPYSDIASWVVKAWTEWNDPSEQSPELIVMLLPSNRPEQLWWQEWVEPYRDRPNHSPLRVEFLKGRFRFIKYGYDKIEPNQRPPFGCCLLIWEASSTHLRNLLKTNPAGE